MPCDISFALVFRLLRQLGYSFVDIDIMLRRKEGKTEKYLGRVDEEQLVDGPHRSSHVLSPTPL